MEKKAEEPVREIKVSYKEARNYTRVPATGVFGGLTGNGEVFCDFFVETPITPSEITVLFKPDGTYNERSEPRAVMSVRELQMGIVLAPHTARVVGEWLINRSEEALRALGKGEEKH